MNRLSLLLAVSAILGFANAGIARPVQRWPYDKMTAEADLIVIATPTEVNDTGKKMDLPGGMKMTTSDNITTPIPAVEMEARFEVLSTLKGEKNKELLFRYYRVTTELPIINGPMLVRFDEKQKMRYLLFLKRNEDGSYSSLTGQVDPGHGIRELGTFP